ncbi:MAG: ABC transporter ATP-binding protein [Flavobacteriales bacterium]
MTEEVLVRAEHVRKKFCKDLKRSLWYGMQDIFSSGSSAQQNLREHEFWAVQDVSFELRRGECLGLIGHNGAGKSTLLKMLNGLIRPDGGYIEMKGKVGALIELGAGFNPILTGRENIFNNAAVLGFSKKDTLAKIDEIIAFSEIEEFLDMPVQNYSSGMKVRLGFAIAAQMEPDILLIDEVLAVGDLGFALKCFKRMDELLKNTAMIFVSHSMPQVARMSTKILMMDHGKPIYYDDDVSTGITKYYELHKNEAASYIGDHSASLDNVILSDGTHISSDGEPFTINYGDDLQISFQINCPKAIVNPLLTVAIYDVAQRNFAEIPDFSKQVQLSEVSGHVTFKVTIPKTQFAQGKYSIAVNFYERKGKDAHRIFRVQSAAFFHVHNQSHGWAPMQLMTQWEYSTQKTNV